MSASFVTAPDDLIYIETWDYLRDLVVLSCTRPYDERDAYDSIDEVELTSLEWSERNASICKCLAYILESVEKDIGNCISPRSPFLFLTSQFYSSLFGQFTFDKNYAGIFEDIA